MVIIYSSNHGGYAWLIFYSMKVENYCQPGRLCYGGVSGASNKHRGDNIPRLAGTLYR